MKKADRKVQQNRQRRAEKRLEKKRERSLKIQSAAPDYYSDDYDDVEFDEEMAVDWGTDPFAPDQSAQGIMALRYPNTLSAFCTEVAGYVPSATPIALSQMTASLWEFVHQAADYLEVSHDEYETLSESMQILGLTRVEVDLILSRLEGFFVQHRNCELNPETPLPDLSP